MAAVSRGRSRRRTGLRFGVRPHVGPFDDQEEHAEQDEKAHAHGKLDPRESAGHEQIRRDGENDTGRQKKGTEQADGVDRP